MAGAVPIPQYRELVEQIPAITYMAEPGVDGRWFYVSPQITSILGFTPEEWLNDPQRWRKQVHPDDLRRVLAEEERTLLKEGDRYRVEYRLRTRDNKYIWIRDEATYACRPDSGRFFMRGLLLDITERKQAEEDLLKSEQRLETTINAAPVVLFALDRNGIFTFSGGKGLQDLGLRPGQIVGESVFERYRAMPETMAHVRRALAGEDFTALDALPNGERIYETRWSPSWDSAGQQQGVIGVATDVTERVRMQEKLRSAQQMEAIGRLAGGIAHDFNNLMNIVLGYAEFVSAENDLTEGIENSLSQIRKAAERAVSLTHQLLAFSRKQVLQPTIVDLNEIVTDTQKMLGRVIGEDIQFEAHLDPDLAPIRADPVQLHQVLVNLALNSRDAMPMGGRLLVETSNVGQEELVAQPGADLPAGPLVMLTVSDTGEGMSAETLKHVFEPFFTTKELGKGTGLGLATVYGIVYQSGGKILVSSTPGKGTTFRVYFQAQKESVEATVETKDDRVSGGSEAILLVEDEPDLRQIARVFLEDFGYRVLEARDVEEALRIGRNHDDPIDLVLTDLVMPTLSGRQVVEQILPVRPNLKVVYMSGYTDDMLVRHNVLEPRSALLKKPFDKVQLARKIRQVLDAS